MTPPSIALRSDLGQRILELARIAAAIHELTISNSAGGTGDDTSTDGAVTEAGHADVARTGLGRIR
jgi:hypothetical protein